MMKKRLLSALLAVAMLASLLTVGASAETTGTYGDLTYSIENNEVTITGCSDTISGTVVIPDEIEGCPVTAIGEKAFYMCDAVTGVELPVSITSIGRTAFAWSGLTSIDIPDRVTVIEDHTFNFCESLKSVYIPDSVTQIEDYAFASSGLEAVYIPDSVTRVEQSAFACKQLKTAVVGGGEGQIYLADWAFLGCNSLSELVLSDSVTYIGHRAFESCTSLTEVVIPDSVTEIDSYAFRDCTALEAVAINPDDSGRETAVFPGAFQNCSSLSQVYLGDGVTVLDRDAFLNCPSLLEIQIPESVTEIGEHALGFICNEDDTYTLVDGFTIYAFINTVGIDYATANDIPCGLLYSLFADDTGTGTWTWASDYIYSCAAYGLVSGYEDNTFRPDRQITRAEFVTMLYKAFQAAGGIDESTGGHPFTDCPASWYQTYISWAYQYGVVNGTSKTTFSPNASITRQDMAVMLYNYLQIFYGMESVSCDLSQFPDQGSISGYARPAVEFCVAYGLINGMANKDGTVTVSPKSPTTRAQAATVFYNAFLAPVEEES